MVKSTILFGLAAAYAPIKTGRGDLECPSGYKQITSSEQCRAACKTLGWASDVHGDRTPTDRGQFMYQQGCIENGLYCYYNEYDPATVTLSAVGQRSMVCDQIGAVVMTSGGSTPCQDAGLFDVMDAEECVTLAKALGLAGANGALDSQNTAHVQNENDRPRGCRVQTFGPAAWINERENPSSGASEVHRVVCKTVCETSTLEDGTAWVSSTGATCEQYAEWEWCTPNGEYGAGWGSSWGTFSDWANEGMSALDACCQCNSGERRREESSGIALAKAAGSLVAPGRLGRLLAGM